jgi:DNA-binding transcriptional LysR family regulator
MDRRALECFSLVARTGSMSAAAGKLFVTQPAVSKQIARLEAELGVRLFHRTPSGLTVTAAGRTLLDLGADVLLRFDRVQGIMESRFAGRAAFRVASPHSTALDLFAPFMAACDPPVVDLEILPARDLDDALNGDVDLAIGSLPPPRHRAQLVVATIPVAVQAPVDHPLFREPSPRIDLEDLGDDWLILPRTGVLTAVVEATREFVPPPRIRETAAAAVAQALAANSHGIAVITEPPRFGLRAVPAFAGGRPVESPLYASWDAHHYGSAELAQVAERLRTWLDEEWQHGRAARERPERAS